MFKIQFTSGCANNCAYCYEPKEISCYEPEIPRTSELIQILDMNFLGNPNAQKILIELPKQKYELVCGFDFRLITQEICNLMKEKGFVKVRWGWDYNFSQQKRHREVFKMLVGAGYKPRDLSVFMIVNWKIPFVECCQKLDLLKVWNVKVNDCCWDGGYKMAKPKYWTPEQIKKFRRMSRKHNQLILFGIDPEY